MTSLNRIRRTSNMCKVMKNLRGKVQQFQLYQGCNLDMDQYFLFDTKVELDSCNSHLLSTKYKLYKNYKYNNNNNDNPTIKKKPMNEELIPI
jgi:hypothetical protein